MPQKNWGVLGGLVITAICPVGQFHAAQEPIMRVLVLESKQLRFRADGDKPLLVFGIGLNKKRISTLKIRQRNGRFQIAINGSSSRWSYLPGNVNFRIRSKDPRGIWLGKRRYRGELRVLVENNRIQVVNHLGVEKYLSSVVGSEMPKSWPMAALQAQAIAARTYALQQGRKKKFYDVNSTEKSQVYLGIESETKSIVCNVDEKNLSIGNKYTESVKKKYSNERIVIICADIEDQIMDLDNKERESFMKEIGLDRTGLNKLIREGYSLLNLDTFFTSGPEESRAWTIEKNSKAPDAAGVIHSDFKKKFIRAETVSHDDFIKYKGFNECKNSGKLRLEGKDYEVKDGDVMFFRTGA